MCNDSYTFAGVGRVEPSARGRKVLISGGMCVAILRVMVNDARYALPCRLGLLTGAAIHWIAAALVLSDHLNTTSTWQYAPRMVREIARAVVQSIAGV